MVDSRIEPETRWETDDVELLKWARRHRRILIGFDLYKGLTGPRMDNELHRRGGRLITIAGGPDQPVSRILGKLLFHQETWEPFFSAGYGKVRIETVSTHRGDRVARIKMYRPEELPMLVPTLVDQGRAYLKERKDALHRPLKRAARHATVASGQGALIDEPKKTS